MSANISNSGDFLRTSRNFPPDIQALTVEINRSYTDIASKVNNRVIATFATSTMISGERWVFNGQAGTQSGLRQVYTVQTSNFSAGVANIAHGIDLTRIGSITAIYGTFTDGTNWYPFPYVDTVAVINQISIEVTGSNIVITNGVGAPPAVVRGIIVLEWISFA